MAKLSLATLLAAGIVSPSTAANDDAVVDRHWFEGRPRRLGKAGKASKSAKGGKSSKKRHRTTSPTNEPTGPSSPTATALPSGIPTAKPTAAATTAPPLGPDCAMRQQTATVITEDVCLRNRAVGSEECPECPSSCDSFGSGSTFPLETGQFYTFEINRQQNGWDGIYFNLLSPSDLTGVYMSLFKGTFCDGLTCVTSRDGGPCPGMQERDLEDGAYVLFIHGPDEALYDLDFTFQDEGKFSLPNICSV